MRFLLIVTYLSTQTGLTVKPYPIPTMAECVQSGKQISANVKVGRVSTVCWKNLKG